MYDPLKPIVEPLLRWFDENKRSLPWRRGKEPYHVLVSEIMLQQTRIEAVVRYYERFIQALPDIKSLSEVDDDALLKLWEGLGYYSRAKNLKKAALKVMRDYGGAFPETYTDILTLPGVGEYTAGAIASICFNERIPAVDGNVLRVIARIEKSTDDVLLPQTKKRVFRELKEIMPERAGSFNEALMELGETVCLAGGAPACESCPIKGFCAAYREGLTSLIPVRVKKTKRRQENKSVFLIRSPDGCTAVEKRPDKGLLSGMYQLPNIEGFYSEDELKKILEKRGVSPVDIRFVKKSKHVFTHIDWMMKSFLVKVDDKKAGFLWATQEELSEKYPLPAAFLKLL